MSSDSEKGLQQMLDGLPAPTHQPANCPHESFAVNAAVNRFEDTGRFLCELRIVCVQCREPFRFKGIQPGLAWESPTCSIDGLEANLPIEPEIEKQLFTGGRYEMPPRTIQH